jgi:PIN domain nuclease of toxin-antitoxin system
MNSGHEFLISHVVAWEISIKFALGKLKLNRKPDGLFPDQVRSNGFDFLPIHLSYILKQGELPQFHGDPFDRLLVAQCLVEKIKIISMDPQLEPYGVVLREP